MKGKPKSKRGRDAQKSNPPRPVTIARVSKLQIAARHTGLRKVDLGDSVRYYIGDYPVQFADYYAAAVASLGATRAQQII